MAVVYEDLGGGIVKAYSDAGMMIHGGFPEGNYVEAVDPADKHRTYTETDIPVPEPEPDVLPDPEQGATEQDGSAALHADALYSDRIAASNWSSTTNNIVGSIIKQSDYEAQ